MQIMVDNLDDNFLSDSFFTSYRFTIPLLAFLCYVRICLQTIIYEEFHTSKYIVAKKLEHMDSYMEARILSYVFHALKYISVFIISTQ